MTDTTIAEPTVAPAAEHTASSYSSGGLSAERIVVWVMLLAAFAFWVPYMIVIDGVMFGRY